MTDPERLLNPLSDADALERELLGSIQRMTAPAGAKGEAWAKLTTQIAAVGLVSSAHGSAAAASASSSAVVGWAPTLLKGLAGKFMLTFALASAVSASVLWVHAERKASKMSAPAKPVSAARPELAVQLPEPSAAAPTALSAAPPTPQLPVKASVEQTLEDRLSKESELLTRARAELRRGDAATAQQTLDQLRAKFPRGVLGQEREVLAIEVLAARGNSAAARLRARAFIAAYPKSPHSAQLARFADAP